MVLHWRSASRKNNFGGLKWSFKIGGRPLGGRPKPVFLYSYFGVKMAIFDIFQDINWGLPMGSCYPFLNSNRPTLEIGFTFKDKLGFFFEIFWGKIDYF